MINNKSNLLIHKTTAGNVVFSDNSNPNKVYSIYPQETKIWIDKDSIRQSSRISIGDGRENFSRLQIVATKLNNDPAIPFNGITQTDTDLLDILAAFFIAPTSGTIGTGLATEAKQEMQIAELQSIKNNQTSGLQTIALPTDAAKETKQNNQITELQAIKSNQTNGTQVIQLPTDAATETKQDEIILNQINGRQINKDYFVAVSLGLVSEVSRVYKSGKNPAIVSGSVPESVWNGGGLYTGFPTSGFGNLQVLSSSAADIGTLTITYLPTSASTAYVTENIPVNGIVPTNTAITAYRVHTAFYSSTANTSTQFNVGTITVRYTANPAVVFLAMPAGTNQSYMAGYTVPAGRLALLSPTIWRASLGQSGASMECVMYLRELGQAPRLRRNVSPTIGGEFSERYSGGILLQPLTDIMPTVRTYTSGTAATIEASYEILIFTP